MKCYCCGNELPEGSVFCPNCGANNSNQGAQPAVNYYNQGNAYAPAAPAAPAAPVKTKKKFPIAIVIIALILVVALVVGAIFILPSITGKSTKPGKDNVFATALKDVEKDSEAAAVLEVFSAAYNTIFNTQSFTVEIPELDAEAKIQFGKDLLDSQFVAFIEDETGAGFYDGQFVYANGYSGFEANIKEIAADPEALLTFGLAGIDKELERLQERYGSKTNEDINENYSKEFDAIKEFKAVLDDIEADAENISKTVLSLVENKKLNTDAINEIFSKTIVPYYNIGVKYLNSDSSDSTIASRLAPTNVLLLWAGKLGTVENVFGVVSDFLVNGISEDMYTAEISKEDKITEYTIEFNTQELSFALQEYLINSEDYVALSGADATEVERVKEEISKDREEFEAYSDERKARYDVTLTVEVSDDCVNEITVELDGEKIKISISDINNTVVEEADFEEVNELFDDSKHTDSFDNLGDIEDEFGRGSEEVAVETTAPSVR